MNQVFAPHPGREDGHVRGPKGSSMWSNQNGNCSQNNTATCWRNYGGIIYRDTNGVELGLAVWHPARGQFCFHATAADQALTVADQAVIVAILNSLTR